MCVRLILAHPGPSRPIPAHSGSFRLILAHPGPSRLIPAHSGSFWPIPARPEARTRPLLPGYAPPGISICTLTVPGGALRAWSNASIPSRKA